MIVNDGLGPNKGDQAILVSMLDGLKQILPRTLISTFPNSGMHRIGQYLKFIRALKKADLFIFGGGQEIQDHASLAFLISGLLKITLAKLLSRPIMCYAIGAGPVARSVGKLLVRLLLNKVDMITVRDENSYECLRRLGVTDPPCFVTADPCFALIPDNDHQAMRIFDLEGIGETNEPRIAIAPRRWFHYSHYLLPMSIRARFFSLRGQDEYTRLINILAQTADHLIETQRAQVIFIPMRSASGKFDPGQDDDQVSREIINLMKHKENVFLLRGDYSPNVLKAFLGGMDLVMGMRMHSLIFSSMMNVPVIGLALSEKFYPLFKMIGQSRYLIGLQDVSYRILVEKIKMALSKAKEIKDELELRKKGLQELALSNIAYVQKILINKGSKYVYTVSHQPI